MDYKPKKRVWRGIEFDSQLEADWCASFTAWGLEYVYHPGRVFLGGGVVVWEPDFQVDAGDEGLLFEAKGDHNRRIEKVVQARKEGYNVIVGRGGWIPRGTANESAGAVWEPWDEWILADMGGRCRFFRIGETVVGARGTMYPAHVAHEKSVMGVRWFKAVGKDGIA